MFAQHQWELSDNLARRRARSRPSFAWRQYGVFAGGNRENLPQGAAASAVVRRSHSGDAGPTPGPSARKPEASGNLVFAYLLLGRVGNSEFRRWRHILVAGLGSLALALMLARAFGRFYGGL
jgi:hypothetical protein